MNSQLQLNTKVLHSGMYILVRLANLKVGTVPPSVLISSLLISSMHAINSANTTVEVTSSLFLHFSLDVFAARMWLHSDAKH